MGDIQVSEKMQQIKTLGRFPPELELEPANVDRLYLDNIYKRSLSLLTALYGSQEHVLECKQELFYWD